tara:strand:+ start:783 stop:1400 length:618 start_codon:yes stop_codon:yes gene_type:complete
MFKLFQKITRNSKHSKKFYFLLTGIYFFVFDFKSANAASNAPPFSLANTDFVVAISFFIFIGILIYFKVPRIIINLLDNRANTIRSEIDEANKLLEEAKSLLAKSEREHKENILRAAEIIKSAENTSKKLLEDSKSDIKLAVARKLETAKKQIESNEKSVVNSIRAEIVEAAFKLAEETLVQKLDKNKSNQITKLAIEEIGSKLI